MNLAALQAIAAQYGGSCANKVNEDYYSSEEMEFLKIMQEYKSHCERPHPSWREVLALVKFLGYRKPAE